MKSTSGASFAPSRIKAIAQENSDVGCLSQAALAAIAFAAEHFVRDISTAAVAEAKKGHRQTIDISHIRAACTGKDEWMKVYVDGASVEGNTSGGGESSSPSSSSYAVAPSRKRARGASAALIAGIPLDSPLILDTVNALPSGGSGNLKEQQNFLRKAPVEDEDYDDEDDGIDI
mmetsp:Transcript_55561/g.104246  ORF Transcript_55561/g.104246 Transcript_55561/m.104246 type:complete len:174 (+) Transcript_55561:48-569(+)